MLEQAKQRDGLKVNLVGQLDYERIDTPPKVNATQLQADYPIYTSGRHRCVPKVSFLPNTKVCQINGRKLF